LRFSKEDRKSITQALEKDTEFLKKHQLMDYSLLFAVENNLKNQIIHQKQTIVAGNKSVGGLNSTLVKDP
jgi:hypothetical protein